MDDYIKPTNCFG